MKRNNNGNIIVIIIGVIIIGLLVALILSINTMIKANNEDVNEPKDNVENIGDKVDNTDGTEDNMEEKEPEEVIDPYENYKKITWATKSSIDTKIKDNKLYFLDKEVKTGITGTFKSVETIIVGGFPWIYLITEEGEAWCIGLDDIIDNTIAGKKQLLSKEEIVDMTALETYTNQYSKKTIYFLTKNGKLIDENGVSYDKYSFNNSLVDLSNDIYIPIDKNSYGYYYNESKNTYTAIVSKSNSAKLTFSKVYSVQGKLLIQTEYNKLFEYTGTSNKATQISGTVKTVKKVVDGEKINLAITFNDGTTKIYENVIYGQDVKNKREIDLDSLSKFDFKTIVADGVKIYNNKAAISTCGDDGEPLVMNIKAPKITLLTSNTTKINKQIEDKYSNMVISTHHGGYNLKVDYKYNYVQGKELLLIVIGEEYGAVCATGSFVRENYIYDIKNDKFIDFTELLKRYNITENMLKNQIYPEYLERVQDYYDGDVMQLLNEDIKNDSIKVESIGSNYIEVHMPSDLEGFVMKIYNK